MRRGRIFGKKTIVDGITFDSEMESKYYLHLKEQGYVIKYLEIHKSFTLQESFTDSEGNKHQAITYAPDFIFYDTRDEHWYYVDTKGYLDDMSRLLWKLFVKHIETTETDPNRKKKYQIVKYSKTTGFVNYKDYKRLMASARRKATLEKNEAVAAKNQLEKDLMTIKKLREKETPLTQLQTKKLAELEEKHKDLI